MGFISFRRTLKGLPPPATPRQTMVKRPEGALERVEIASPCPADWNRMAGDDRVRFCEGCRLNVYNLSGMTRHQAEALVAEQEDRLCVRFYRRPDGTVLTRDCPVGLWAVRKQMLRLAGMVVLLAISLWSVARRERSGSVPTLLTALQDRIHPQPMMGGARPARIRAVPMGRLVVTPRPATREPERLDPVMGKMALPVLNHRAGRD